MSSKPVDWTKAEPAWTRRSAILAVWVFGSAQAGTVRAEGDLDIALLMEASPSFEEKLAILGDLQTRLGIEEIDLVILNEANPYLRFEAISGRLLFCRDRQRLAEFASLTAREYEDELALWRRGMRWRRDLFNE